MTKRADTFFFTVAVSLCIILLGVSFGLGAHSSNEKDTTDQFALTILHTNDTHAHDESFREHGHSIGGLARIAYLVHSIKASQKNVLAVDAGDFFQGTMVFQKYKGEAEVNLFNLIGYDVVTLGNHEFDLGTKNLYEQLQLAKFPIISCNLDLSGEQNLAKIVKPSLIKEVDGEKVAFIGAITPELLSVALNTGATKIKGAGGDWIEPIRAEVVAYKQQGINKIVLVTHCGVELDRELANQLPDVDVIVGGHSHTRLEEPIWVDHQNGNFTAVVQTGSYGRALGNFNLHFNSQGQLLKPVCHYSLIAITDKVPEDPEVVAYVHKKIAPLLVLRHQIDGTAGGVFENLFKTMPCDSAIGDMICDALYEQASGYGATIALQNRGGIRGRIEKGPISEEKVQEVFPFDNKAVSATISGSVLLANMEHSLGGPLGGSFLDVHGLKIGYDPSKPRGERIIFALAQGNDGQWQPVDPARNYKIVVNDYTFKGGEKYDFKSATNVIYSESRIADVLRNYLARHKVIEPTKPERIVALTTGLAQLKLNGSGRPQVIVSGVPAGAKVSLLQAGALGVESLHLSQSTPITVPLAKPTLAKFDKSSSADGQLVFTLPAQFDRQKPAYVAVVVEPGRRAANKSTLVSCPLAVTAAYNTF